MPLRLHLAVNCDYHSDTSGSFMIQQTELDSLLCQMACTREHLVTGFAKIYKIMHKILANTLKGFV